VQEIWVMGHPHLTHYVDITENFPRKVAALRAHDSQVAHLEDLEGFVRGWAERNAAAAGLPEGRLAEGFFISTMPI
jgi:LmbE family N-acetylglucosaminyl deacetylase